MDSTSLKKAPIAKPQVTNSPSSVTQAPDTRPFASRFKKKQKQDFITWLRNSAGFLMATGVLLTGFGIVCFIPFHNQFSKLMLDIGLLLFFFAFIVKAIDLFIKIVTER